MWVRTIIVKRKNASIIYRGEPNLFIALLSNRRGLFLCRPVPRRGRWLFDCQPWKARYIGWLLSAFLRHRHHLLQQSWFLALFNFVAMLRVFLFRGARGDYVSPFISPFTTFFVTFSAKSFAVSIIFFTFTLSYPYWKLQLGEGGVDIYT